MESINIGGRRHRSEYLIDIKLTSPLILLLPLIFFISAISEYEKSIIRAELTKCFNETTDAIASQLAVLVAKISRYEEISAY